MSLCKSVFRQFNPNLEFVTPDQKRTFALSCEGFACAKWAPLHANTHQLSPSCGRYGCQRGFSLVISLVLMGFMLLLVVSLGTLVRVEVVAEDQRVALGAARENAYLGMMVALGELQKAAGPDQRVTARADILENADRGGAEASVRQPSWTGVWDKNGNLLTWLVSGNVQNGTAGVAYPPQSALSKEQSVQLVGEGAIGSGGGSAEVFAPLVDLPSGRGSFAYWIGDEGVKTKANRSPVGAVAEASTPVNADLLAPRRFGVGSMAGMSWVREVNETRLNDLIDDASLWVLGGGDSAVRSAVSDRFDDLTVWSYGVLADAANGGLKKDLTAGLFGVSGPTDLKGSIFAPPMGGNASLRNPGGPDWRQLRSWAKTTGDAGGVLPVRAPTDVQAGFYPILSQAQLYFMPVYKTEGNTNPVYLYLMPAVVLWNPYDRPLEAENYTLIFARNLTLSEDPGSTTTRHNPLRTINLYLDDGSGNTGSWTRYTVSRYRDSFTVTIPNVSLAPGEAKVYSPPAGKTPYVWTHYPTNGENMLQPGYRPEAVFYCITEDEQSAGGTLKPTPSLTPVPGSTDPEKVLNDYYWGPSSTDVLALFFLKGSGTNLEPLQDVLFLSNQNSVLPTQAMIEFNTPLTTSVRQAQAVGYKFVRNYSDNTLTSSYGGKIKWLAALNPRGVTSGSAGRAYGSGATRNLSYTNKFFSNGYDQSIDEGISSGRTFAGHDERVNDVSETILYEASPGRYGLWSVGQFMHAPLFRWEPDDTAGRTLDERVYWREQYARFDNMMPAYAVGNSDANPFITDLTATYLVMPGESVNAYRFGQSVVRYDYSYLLNEALWDRYFLSTLPDQVVTGGKPVNPRLVRYPDDSGSFTTALDDTAKHLMLDGAFNVNSTSVEAWKALLSSYFGMPVTKNNGTAVASGEATPFLRTAKPVGTAVGPNSINPARQSAYNGYRLLSENQIATLAVEIVRQVRLRGPFTSLADFVNRSTNAGDDVALQLRGALAEAIARSEINKDLQTVVTQAKSLGLNAKWANPVAEEGWTNEQVPGWFSQADIMSRLGSVFSARSDTFRIRSYGEYTGVGGSVQARAWCEAIVQRVPAYVDGENAPESALADLNSTNREFGRRFIIVSFRWLTEDEI